MQIWVIRIALFASMIIAFTLSLESKRRTRKIAYYAIAIGGALILGLTV